MYYGSDLIEWSKTNIDCTCLGVFASNELPKLNSFKILPYYLIVNTDNRNLPGQHWVCIFVYDSNIAEIFDSFGRFPNNYIQHWLNTYSRKWYYNTRIVQPLLSTSCGLFCLYFIYYRYYNSKLCLNQFINNLFSYNVYENEFNVNQLYYTNT